MDRINNKELIIGFLKEIYRFQNVLDEQTKDKFIFIIAIKPEAMLYEKSNKNERIYSKIFDVIINLKTIHFEDYESVLLSMIKSDIESQRALQQLIKEPISEKLPRSFDWILKGENLTLRDLKDRLNHAIAIMVSLKNKNYKDVTSVNFEACAAVAYLESQSPENFYSLVREEKCFACLITESYTVKNASRSMEELITKFNDIFSDNEQYDDDFIEDLCHLILSNVFDDDFRMYFYTYPNESYIKTTDEKDVCNLIKLPNSYNDFEKLDEKVNRIWEKRPNSIVIDTIKSLDQNDAFLFVLLLNDKLFEIATEYSSSNMLALLTDATLNIPFDNNCAPILARLSRINISSKERFIKNYVANIVSFFTVHHNAIENIFELRKLIIENLKNYIIHFKDLFVNNDKSHIMPLITKEEIDMINNIDISLQLIDVTQLSNDYEYIASAINKNALTNPDVYPLALGVYDVLIDIVDNELLSEYLIDFLIKNLKVNDLYFTVIIQYIDNDRICTYVNNFKAEQLSDIYFNLLDICAICNGLNEDIIIALGGILIQ